jgi:hypothetical protein
MTKNQKILVGLGIGALVVYVFTRMGKKAQTATDQPQSEGSGMQLPTKPQIPTGSGGVTPPTMVADYSNRNTTISSNITQDERTAIQEAKNQSGKKYRVGDVIVTRLGNFKYVIIRQGTKSGVSLGQPPIYDWVRTTDQPQVYGTPTTRTIGEILK